MFSQILRSRLTRIFALLALIAFGIPIGAQADMDRAVPKGQSRPPICSTSFDPYKVSTAILRACGYHVFPLEKVVRLPDGGREYVYTVEGVRQINRIPPSGLDLTQAPASVRNLYGIPPKPSDPAALARWKAMVRKAHFITPPKAIITTNRRASTTVTDPRWSGYMATSSSSSTYK